MKNQNPKYPTMAHEVLGDALIRWEQEIKDKDDSVDGSEMVDWFFQTFVPAAKAALKGRRK